MTTLADAKKKAPGVIPSPRGADHYRPFAIQIMCKACGSTNVTRDSTAAWNHATQKWELSSVQDAGCCDDCGATTLLERFTDAQGRDLGPVDDLELTEAEEAAKWGDSASILKGRMDAARARRDARGGQVWGD